MPNLAAICVSQGSRFYSSEDVMAHANPIQLQKYLKGVNYPADKQTLVANAKKLGADQSICASLEQLPEQEFRTPAEVSQAFKDASSDASDETPSSVKNDEKPASGAEERNAFLLKAMQDTVAEMELCMVALKKSHSEEVLSLAETMIEEHGQLGLEMEQLAQKKNMEATLELSEENIAVIDEISHAPDCDFDRRFLEQNLKDHEDHLNAFRRCAAQEKDREIRALAEKGEKMLSKHLKMVKEIEERIPA
jgi:predicted outer membrane protein